MCKKIRRIVLLIVLWCPLVYSYGQYGHLSIRAVLDSVESNYGMIKAKENMVKAGSEQVAYSKLQAIPDLNMSVQNTYGTINNLYGASAGLRGNPSISSSGPVLPSQNWNAAFGGLYLANINWDFFSFGKIKQGIRVSDSNLELKQKDLSQEIFQDKVKACAAYLNLIGAQQLTKVAQDNLTRAIIVKNAVVPRVLKGLNAGVDTSFAVADVASAQIALTQAQDHEQELATALIKLMGSTNMTLPSLDTAFISRVPLSFIDTVTGSPEPLHPVLQYYNARIIASKAQEKYIHTQFYPTFSLFTTYQAKASGFRTGYGAGNLSDYTTNYFDGVGTLRHNYLVGVSATWDLTTPVRLQRQQKEQMYLTQSLRDEYAMNDQQLSAQLALANVKIKNALSNYRQMPTRLKAAGDAFVQKTELYKNGLNTIIDVQQALYLLNSAEVDKYITYNNVWQALLIKAAAMGDLNVFLDALQ